MFREIFRFELRYQLSQPLFWLSAAIFFLLTFGAVTTDAVVIGGSIGSVHRNAPYVIMQFLLVMSIVGVFLTTAFVANPVLRDVEHGTQSLFFSTPLRKRDYLLGRFAGALVVALAVFLPVALAIVVGSWMPWLDPDRIGPFRWAPYVFSLVAIVGPNILLTGAIFFALATMTRSMLWTYAGVVVFFVGYGVSQTFLAQLERESLAAILDPFGAGAFAIATKYWTVAERNTQVLGLDGTLLRNRLIWLGIALAVIAAAYARFRPALHDGRAGRSRGVPEPDDAAGHGTASSRAAATASIATPGSAGAPESPAVPAPAAPAAHSVPAVARDFSGAAARRQYFRQTRAALGRIVRSLPFGIILALAVLNVVGSATGIEQFVGTPVHPVTHLMISVINGAFLLFAFILLTLYAGEMVWHEREANLSDVLDALPVPGWVFWASKLTALVLLVALLLAVAVATGVGIQLYHGYADVELGLYARGVFLVVGIPLALLAVLALFLQVVANNKFAGFLLMIVYFIGTLVLSSLDLRHNLYRYAESPAAPYSDMNGYGHFAAPTFWFYLYWTFGAVLLGVLIHLFWVRGRETEWRVRLRIARRRLTRPAVAAAAAAALAFVATGAFIFYNTNVLNAYVPNDVAEARRARYEKEYKRFEGAPQPKIAAVYAEVDIHPERRALDVRGRYTMVNRSGAPIDSLHLEVDPDLEIRSLDVPGGALEHQDAEIGYRIYRLASPLAPGDTLVLGFDLGLVSRGFVNHGANTGVVRNGTFINNFGYFPHIGYSGFGELQDPNDRRKHGLPPIERMPPLTDDPVARAHNYIGRESDWIDFETVVSTDASQIALAPGYLRKEWEENGRRYFHYAMDAPILGFFAYLSADWEVARDHWNDVAIEVYHHPAHAYNVPRMIDAVKKSLDYFTREFGPYQHRQVRIVEFPRYASFAQSFPNTIPFSESIGFIARLDDHDDLDYVFYVTAHEVAHQWWAHQVIGAEMQGATITSETMAQYSALMVMENEYGAEHMRRFLKYELDAYLRGRGGERIQELPLRLVENQPYIHYRKGSLAMYALKDYVGERALNDALARYVRDVGFSGPPYTTSDEFLAYVREAVPEDRAWLVEDLFETITLFDLRAREAAWERRDDGRYAVRLAVDARKYRAGGLGAETEVPLDLDVDVGVFGRRGTGDPPEGKVLRLEKRRVTGPATTLEIVVDEEPARAGIDPFNKLIDRNPEDNIVVAAAGRPQG